MRMNKKKVFALALAVCLIATLSMGSLAWFTDDDSVTNEFYIASSDDTTADDIFSVDVWENTPDDEEDQDGYVYEDILPGDVLEKEVVVENTGYYDQYVRVTVTVSDAAAWMAALNTTTVPRLDKIVDGYDPNANIWVNATAVHDETNDTLVYVLYYNYILLGAQESIYDGASKHSESVTVFTAIKIPGSLTVEQAAAFESNFEITVKAEAVQTENLGIDRTAGEGAAEAFAVVEGNP